MIEVCCVSSSNSWWQHTWLEFLSAPLRLFLLMRIFFLLLFCLLDNPFLLFCVCVCVYFTHIYIIFMIYFYICIFIYLTFLLLFIFKYEYVEFFPWSLLVGIFKRKAPGPCSRSAEILPVHRNAPHDMGLCACLLLLPPSQ